MKRHISRILLSQIVADFGVRPTAELRQEAIRLSRLIAHLVLYHEDEMPDLEPIRKFRTRYKQLEQEGEEIRQRALSDAEHPSELPCRIGPVHPALQTSGIERCRRELLRLEINKLRLRRELSDKLAAEPSIPAGSRLAKICDTFRKTTQNLRWQSGSIGSQPELSKQDVVEDLQAHLEMLNAVL